MDRDEKKIMNRIRSDYDLLEQMGYTVLGVFLQGSQNYGLDYEKSDIDTKAIVLPGLKDLALNRKPTSTTHVLPSNEHIDIKDVRLMFQTFRKQNINFIEILFTNYYHINPEFEDLMSKLLLNAEAIARYDESRAVSCMLGMAYEKRKALEHPYPATIDKIEEFGFDPKQLHHILRMHDFMFKYTIGLSYKKCLTPARRDYLLEIKKGFEEGGIISVERARQLSEIYLDDMKEIKESFLDFGKEKLQPNLEVETFLDSLVVDLLKKHFKKELN